MKKFEIDQNTKDWLVVIGYTGACVAVSVLTWKWIAKMIGIQIAKELLKAGVIAIAM